MEITQQPLYNKYIYSFILNVEPETALMEVSGEYLINSSAGQDWALFTPA